MQLDRKMSSKAVLSLLAVALVSPTVNSDCPTIHAGPTLPATCKDTEDSFMGILEDFIRAQSDVEDPCGRPFSRDVPDKEYDFIVVGGGSAGAVVASRLSEIPEWRVLLIEAGGNEPTGTQVPSMFLNFLGSSVDWTFKTEPEENACLNEPEQRCTWWRGKVIGGTSVLNGMMYMRGARKDFDDWANLGNYGWSYEQVLPYFLKSEDNLQTDIMDPGYHSTGGPLTVTQFPYAPPLSHAILQGGVELGYSVRDLNGESHTGFAIAQTTSQNGVRLSTSKAFLRPVKDRPNLHILLDTTVSSVLIDPTTKEAYGVNAVRSNGELETIIAKNEVILCGGAINSPQLLLLSGVGPEADLQNLGIPVIHNLDSVGKNLHNHVSFFVNFFMNEPATTLLNWATAVDYLVYRNGLMSTTGISAVTGLVNTKFADPTEDYPDIQFFFGGYTAGCSKTGVVGEGTDEGGVTPQRTISIIPAVLHPKSRGAIKLKSSNPLDHPLIFGNYFQDPADADTLVEGIKIAIELAETPALQNYGFRLDQTPVKGCEDITFGSDEYWQCAVRRATGPENHQAGSCRMGPVGDPGACVDPELRVHGIHKLRVMDASVMPRVTSSNTNAPVIMIAEKGVDMIKNQWLNQNGFSASDIDTTLAMLTGAIEDPQTFGLNIFDIVFKNNPDAYAAFQHMDQAGLFDNPEFRYLAQIQADSLKSMVTVLHQGDEQSLDNMIRTLEEEYQLRGVKCSSVFGWFAHTVAYTTTEDPTTQNSMNAVFTYIHRRIEHMYP